MPYLLRAAARWMTPQARMVIAGPPHAPATAELLHAAHSVYLPFKTVLGTTGPVDSFARSLPAVEGKPTAYICMGTTCRTPVTSASALRDLLTAAR